MRTKQEQNKNKKRTFVRTKAELDVEQKGYGGLAQKKLTSLDLSSQIFLPNLTPGRPVVDLQIGIVGHMRFPGVSYRIVSTDW